jgi:hypothetical protein
MPVAGLRVPAPASNTDGDGETIAVVGRLARKGAYAIAMGPVGAAAGAFAVFSPRNAFERPIAHVPTRAIADAVRRGWLAADITGARLRLTEDGLRAVRRARSGQGVDALRAPSAAQIPRATVQVQMTARPQRVESPLVWLRRRRDKHGRPLITEAQFTAGERLAAAFHAAHLRARVTADWTASAPGRRLRRGAPGTGVEMSDHVVAARERFNKATAAVGPELAGVLIEVCCQDMGLEAVEQGRGWPQRSARVVLDMGLTALARHFGLITPHRPASPSRMRRWSEAGFTADLEAWR